MECTVARSITAEHGIHLSATSGAASSEAISRIELTGLPSAAFQARRHAKEMLTLWHANQLIETAELLVSELVTNAVRFSRPGQDGRAGTGEPPGIALTLRMLATGLLIEVWDPDPAPPVLVRGTDGQAESGRGLMITEALSKGWGHCPAPGGGKVVYCLVGT